MAMIPTSDLQSTSVDAILANAGGSSVLIPDADYKMVIVASTIKDTNSGGKYLELKEVITEGPHADVELIERLNIVNSNTTTVKIAYEALARIAKAVGLDKIPNDSTQLHNKKFIGKTKTEAGQDWVNNEGETVKGKDKSVIDSRGYKPLPAVGTPVGTVTEDVPFEAPSESKMPWQ